MKIRICGVSNSGNILLLVKESESIQCTIMTMIVYLNLCYLVNAKVNCLSHLFVSLINWFSINNELPPAILIVTHDGCDFLLTDHVE